MILKRRGSWAWMRVNIIPSRWLSPTRLRLPASPMDQTPTNISQDMSQPRNCTASDKITDLDASKIHYLPVLGAFAHARTFIC